MNTARPELVDYDTGHDRRSLSSVNVLDGNWHHVALVRDAANSRLYVDGVLATSSSSISRASLAADNFIIGAGGNGGSTLLPGYYFNGSIDEVRLSVGTARSAQWIATEYANQNSPSTFYMLGPVELSAGSVSTGKPKTGVF